MIKRILAAAVCLCVLSGAFGVCASEAYTSGEGFYNKINEISYNDMGYLPVDNWSNTAVFTVSALGIMKGFESDFEPYSQITAVEAMAVLFRCAGLEGQASQLAGVVAEQRAATPDAYNNIAVWADGYMRLAVDKKLITVDEYMGSIDAAYPNVAEPVFRKDEPVTKGELVKWIIKVFEIPLAEKENELLAFTDRAEFKEEDVPYFETALRNGIINGSGDTLSPYVTLSREQTAQILFNIRDIWLPISGIQSHHSVVTDVLSETVKEEDTILRRQTLVCDGFTVEASRQYRMNGEEVDYTVYDGLEYKDTVVIARNSLPQDTSGINKGDNITCYTSGGEAILILKELDSPDELTVFNPDEYTDGGVYSGTLYLLDTDERQVIVKNGDSYTELPYIRDFKIRVRTRDVDFDSVNTEYADCDVYVFTAVKKGGNGERAYHMQIIERKG